MSELDMAKAHSSINVELVCSLLFTDSFQYHCAAARMIITSCQSLDRSSYVNPLEVIPIVTKNIIGLINQKISKLSIRLVSKITKTLSPIMNSENITATAIARGLNIPINIVSSKPTSHKDIQFLTCIIIKNL
jgi:hypothetical protein